MQYILLTAFICAQTAAAQDYRLEVSKSPFRYGVWAADTAVVEQNVADTAHTGLYFLTQEGAQYLEGPLSFASTDSTLEAEFATSDGRLALLRIEPLDEEEGYKVDLRFSPEKGVLGVGDMLRVHAGEELYSTGEVGERGSGSSNASSAINAHRGDFVQLEDALMGYESSRGYELRVEGKSTGFIDMASRVGDRVQFEIDDAALSYCVILKRQLGGSPSSR